MDTTQPPTNAVVSAISRLLLYIRPHVDKAIEESVRPFNVPEILLPHDRSKRWGWTHYGVFIPSLPEPYRYMNTVTAIGGFGNLVFDNDYTAAPDARNSTSVLSSTAYGETHHFEAYDTST